jgi:hypothetical protein
MSDQLVRPDNDDGDVLCWGAVEIGATIKRTPRAAFHLLESGALPARKVKGRWVASRRNLLNPQTWPKS